MKTGECNLIEMAKSLSFSIVPQLFMLIIIISLLLSCSGDEEKTRVFDYSDYKNYHIEKLHLECKIPKNFEEVQFSDDLLELLKEQMLTQPYNFQRNTLISALFDQKKGELILLYDSIHESEIIITSFPYTKLTHDVVKTAGRSIKSQIEYLGARYGLFAKLKNVYVGNAGKVSYALFEVESNGRPSLTFIVTLGVRSWRMHINGDKEVDYEAILSSFRFP